MPNLMEDHIVIAGISGRFPESDSLEEFWVNLRDGVDMVTEQDGRRLALPPGVPTRAGKLRTDLRHFDAAFFGVHAKQAEKMDPNFRMLHEVAWEAIVDAGVNPKDLRGARVGVFVGATQTQALTAALRSEKTTSAYDTTGSFGGMAANRISYAFDFKGPSYTVDTLCSSSMLALHNAAEAIRHGECDAALVGGVNANLHPGMTLQIHKSGALSADGRCKAYDSSANGYVRSEAVVAVFLQKRSVSRRAYARLLASGTNSDGWTPNGISSPSEEEQRSLMRDIYKGIDVDKLVYIEGHGTGTAAGDPAELNAIANALIEARSPGAPPVLVGSVKSNMGHSEAASGLCSIAKVVLALQNGILPANLHFRAPNSGIPALLDGRLKVVAENTPVGDVGNGGLLFALNSFGFGGSNVHVVLESIAQPPEPPSPPGEPKLVLFSGTTQEGVQFTLEKMKQEGRDHSFEALLNSIALTTVPGHAWRGYALVDAPEGAGGDPSVEKVPHGSGESVPPLWYIFSGMGTVYRGMFDDLLALPTFARAIEACNVIAAQFGLELLELSRSVEDEPINANMGLLYAAMQVGLIDTLRALGLTPAGMIGHSAGELSCAYADGCLTAEQFLCILHHKDVLVTTCSGGSMAAVGLSWENTVLRCPAGIYPACHNDLNSVTIAGPVEAMEEFVKELQNEGIFARMIDTGGVSYHSPYLAPILAGYESAVLSELAKTDANLRIRSPNWISTCIPEGAEDAPEFRSASPEYFIANIRDPVKFYGATRHIPPEATLLEISSHSLFVSILRKSRPPPTDGGAPAPVLGLIRRGQGDSHLQLLTSIGKLYQLGYNPDLNTLASTPIQFPVTVGTRMIAPLIRWDHSREWELMDYSFAGDGGSGAVGGVKRVDVDTENDEGEHAFVRGHKIEGRVLFPATGYLEQVWRHLAAMQNHVDGVLAIEFSDIRFENPIIIRQGAGEGKAAFEVSIASRSGGSFQCTTPEGIVLVKGNVKIAEKPKLISKNLGGLEKEGICLTSEDVYKLTRLAGFDYDGLFKGIQAIDFGRNEARISWNDNWTAFLDTVLQLDIITDEHVCIKVPTGLQKLIVDPATFLNNLQENTATINFDPTSGVMTCPGLRIEKLKVCILPKRIPLAKPVVEELKFVPYFDRETSDLTFDEVIKFFTDLVLENCGSNRIYVQESVHELQHSLAPSILRWARAQPMKEAEITVKTEKTCGAPELGTWREAHDPKNEINVNGNGFKRMPNLFVTNSIEDLPSAALQGPRFILLHTNEAPLAISSVPGYIRVAEKCVQGTRYILYGKKLEIKTPPLVVHVKNEDLAWVPKLQEAIQTLESKTAEDCPRVYVVASTQPYSGIVGFINCLRHESAGQHVRCIASPKPLPPFNLQTPGALYTHIFEADLVMNIFDEAPEPCLGSLRHFPLTDIKEVDVNSAYVNYETKGDLSTLKFFESAPLPLNAKTEPQKVCEVAYGAVNFRDLMLATGKLRNDAIPGASVGGEECLLGLEFSGWDANEERIMGMVPSKGLATHVAAHSVFTWLVPKHWSLQDAATVPVAYSTAYYALIIRGGLKTGDSVLIHSGSGGVGQAAIAVALAAGAVIFTTVGSDEKRRFLLARFPELNPANIGSSRSLDFEQLIQERTDGHGADIVLNSLTEEKLDASLRCLASGGRFLEIGKYDLSENRPLGMEILLRNISVHGILLDALFACEGTGVDKSETRKVWQLVQGGIEAGIVTPLCSTVYPRDQVEPAFRFMASGKHVGKVLIEMREEGGPAPAVRAVGRTYFDPAKVYIILGGLGGFGFELGRWMVEERGCRRLVLVSRNAEVKNGYQAWLIGCWRSAGIWVHLASAGDELSTPEGAVRLLQSVAQGQGPIGGIFNSAMVLRDAQFKNLTVDAFREVFAPKLVAAVALDAATRHPGICPPGTLDHFVVFSSYSSGRGVFGQSNYGWANSVMERICEARRADGLPGLAVQWGAIGDVGVVHDQMGVQGDEANLYGLAPQRLNSCLAILDTLLRQSHAQERKLSPVVTSWVEAKRTRSTVNAAFRKLTAPPGIVLMLCRILGLTDIPSNKKLCLLDHGLDSLMAVEAKQVLESYFNTQLTTEEVRRLSWERLVAMEGERGLCD